LRTDFSSRCLPRPKSAELLRTLLDRVTRHDPGRAPVMVFDLDGTLMDNRPRVVAILRELAEKWRARHPEAADRAAMATSERIVYGFVDNLRHLGVEDPELHHHGLAFWQERFFADPHIRHDVALPGAAAYVRACYDGGATIVYLTGRDLPNMAMGSFASLRDLGFPIGVVGTELVVKPRFETPDHEFKHSVAPSLRRLGEVVAVFDNEPANCNLFLDAHPACTSVFLDTQHAPNPPPLDPRVHVIEDFDLGR
jgi:hypothetical protein